MLLSAVSVLVVAQSISEIPEGLMNNPVEDSFRLIFSKRSRSVVQTNIEGVPSGM